MVCKKGGGKIALNKLFEISENIGIMTINISRRLMFKSKDYKSEQDIIYYSTHCLEHTFPKRQIT